MIDERLLQAGIVAVPLLKTSQNLGELHPNFLIIQKFGDKTKTLFPLEGAVQELDSIQVQYKIVFREILAENSSKQEEFIERVVLPSENVDVPFVILPTLVSHKAIWQNLATANFALSLFEFRGVLTSLILKIDEEKLNEILTGANQPVLYVE